VSPLTVVRPAVNYFQSHYRSPTDLHKDSDSLVSSSSLRGVEIGCYTCLVDVSSARHLVRVVARKNSSSSPSLHVDTHHLTSYSATYTCTRRPAPGGFRWSRPWSTTPRNSSPRSKLSRDCRNNVRCRRKLKNDNIAFCPSPDKLYRRKHDDDIYAVR